MAAFKVVVTDPAAQDLQDIADYIAKDLREPATAKKQLSQIREAVLNLAEFPTRHALVADDALAALGYRMLVVDNYLVFYITSDAEDTVTIVRVLSSRRDWMSIL
jgi:toxin ParE1/3/4